MALIFMFRNQTGLEGVSGPKPGNQSPIWACFPPLRQHPDQTAISRQKATKKRRAKGVKHG